MQNRKSQSHRENNKKNSKTGHALNGKMLLLRMSIYALFLFGMFYPTSAAAGGLKGHINISRNISEIHEDGQETADSSRFNQNLLLDFQKFITPYMSYHLHLRESLTDSESISSDVLTTFNKRALEPSLDFSLRNPMYTFSAGYRRQEEWSTATPANESRLSTIYYYSRLNFNPEDLPSLSFDFDRREDFDYQTPRTVDSSINSFSVHSRYTLPSDSINLNYYLSYSHVTDKDALSIIEKSTTNNVSANYRIGYSGYLWDRKARYNVNYRGNYSRNKTRQFISTTGSTINERTAIKGLYIQDVNDQTALNSLATLADDNTTVSTGINISTGTDHQIGVLLSNSKTVDRLYIYVTKDVSGETNLTTTSNWSVLSSNFNQLNTWSSVSISAVTITTDTANNIFRYEIVFSSPQNASYFKAINNATSSVLNTEVTEIEALGTDEFDSDEVLNVVTMFVQGINVDATVEPADKLSIAMNYSLDRSDQNPESLPDSMGGVLENIFSNTVSSEKSSFRSLISRNFSLSGTWDIHRLLSATLGFQKNENFDNREQNDFESDTYRLLFRSIPLPSLDMTLSLIKSDSFNFSEKTSKNSAALFSMNSELYDDLNMIVDVGYTDSESIVSGTTTKSHNVNTSLDARITKKLTGTLNYSYNRTISRSSATDFTETFLIMNYRPGRLINITGDVKFSNADGILTYSEGISLDWRPLRAFRISMNYEHSDSEPDPARIDTLNGLIIWYLTRFADLRFTYSYTRQINNVKTENYNYNTTLNCRF